MSYTPQWTDAPRLTGQEYVRAGHFRELADAIDRRRRLGASGTDGWPAIAPHSHVLYQTAISLRSAIGSELLSMLTGRLGGGPIASPCALAWLWPFADGDEDKVLVANNPQSGQVSLFQKLNGTYSWGAPMSWAAPHIQAIHINELRQALEWISRGRWVFPLYLPGGLFSPLPDVPWLGGVIANDGVSELRTAGAIIARNVGDGGVIHGLSGIAIRSTSSIELTADLDCRVSVGFLPAPAVDWDNDPPCWDGPWAGGGANAQPLGELTLTAGQTGRLSSAALTAALQQIADGGAESNFLISRMDCSNDNITITGNVVAEFDLTSPPN